MTNAPTRTLNRIVAYCLQCDAEFGDAPYDILGRLFICPNDDPQNPKHLARVVKLPTGKEWLALERMLLKWETAYSPMCWFGSWGGAFTGRAGLYVATRLVLLLAVGVTLPLVRPPEPITALGASLLSLVVIGDILVSNTSVAFVSRFPAHPIRTVLFTTIAWLTLASAFANIYLTIHHEFDPQLSFTKALYFSVVTLATVGYGDIKPRPDASVAQLVVVGQIVIGLYFLVVLLAVVASWANTPPIDRPLLKLDVLRGRVRPDA